MMRLFAPLNQPQHHRQQAYDHNSKIIFSFFLFFLFFEYIIKKSVPLFSFLSVCFLATISKALKILTIILVTSLYFLHFSLIFFLSHGKNFWPKKNNNGGCYVSLVHGPFPRQPTHTIHTHTIQTREIISRWTKRENNIYYQINYRKCQIQLIAERNFHFFVWD